MKTLRILLFTLFIAVVAVDGQPSECPGGWDYYYCNCYYTTTDLNGRKTHTDAKNYCPSLQSDAFLTSVSDEAEWNFIKNISVFLAGNDYWLGLDGSANTWYDGNPSTYRNWVTLEPNEATECVIYRSNGWFDRTCNVIDQYYYTCKKESLHPELCIVTTTTLVTTTTAPATTTTAAETTTTAAETTTTAAETTATTGDTTTQGGPEPEEDYLLLILVLSLGIGIVLLTIIILLLCCCCECCPLYDKCCTSCKKPTERHSRGAGATDNSQPLSDITATTYEPLNENTQRPVNYEQLPSQTGQQQDYYNVQQHDYYNVSNPSNVNTASPYEELNINTQRPPIYDQLNHGYS